jgi:hypothetical protein
MKHKAVADCQTHQLEAFRIAYRSAQTPCGSVLRSERIVVVCKKVLYRGPQANRKDRIESGAERPYAIFVRPLSLRPLPVIDTSTGSATRCNSSASTPQTRNPQQKGD